MCCGNKRVELRGSSTPKTTPNLAQNIQDNVAPQTSLRAAPLETRDANPAGPPVNAAPNVREYTMTNVASGFQSAINLRYVERSPIQVRGPITGRTYEFSGSRPVQDVDARDAATLLRTRFFRRA